MLNCFWLQPLGRSLDVLQRHIPLGTAWLAFRIQGKRAYRMMSGFAGAFEDAWTALCNLATELNPYSTSAMLPEWEAALNLPDNCLPAVSSDDDRRSRLVFRMQKRRWTTAQDWTDLATLFGLEISITPGWAAEKSTYYAFQYPKRYDVIRGAGKFRVYIDVLNVDYFGGYAYGGDGHNNGYPLPYGLKGSNPLLDAFMCLIDRIRPANVVVIWNANPLRGFCYVEPFEQSFADSFCSQDLMP